MRRNVVLNRKKYYNIKNRKKYYNIENRKKQITLKIYIHTRNILNNVILWNFKNFINFYVDSYLFFRKLICKQIFIGLMIQYEDILQSYCS